jgi:PadR family transcriptional regulator PadR
MVKDTYRNRIDLLQGTLDLLILETLRWGAQHGYGITQAIRTRSGEVLQVETGSLYPALHRLERQKWVKSKWQLTEQNQRAKFYELTADGKAQLSRDRTKWEAMVQAIAGVLGPVPEPKA